MPYNFEIRSNEVEDILGYIPSWIIRWGIALIFIIIIVLLIGSYFFKYPDIVRVPVTLITENPPAVLKASVSGKIMQLFVKDKDEVIKNQYLAIIENPADYEQIKNIITKLDSLDVFFKAFDITTAVNFEPNASLGSLQTTYTEFLTSYKEYITFIQLSYYPQKIESLKKQLTKYNIYYSRIDKQSKILEEELLLSKSQFERNEKLYKENVISSAQFENAKAEYLQKKYSYEGTRSSLANTQIQISQIEQTIIDSELQYKELKQKNETALSEKYNNLKNAINLWELTYVLKAPINGVVSFTRVWSINQNVKAGENVITVVPKNSGNIIGKAELITANSGKVKIGQSVNIKFSSFPHLEYGWVKGFIKSKSLVPDNKVYILEIQLPNKLKTTYNKLLPFTQEMTGEAEIITKNKRLIERLIEPIRALINQD